MKLRTQLNLIVASLSAIFLAGIIVAEIESARRSVHDEIEGASIVAAQLLNRVAWIYARTGARPMLDFLEQLGRVRANDITLRTDAGETLYRSPPSPYKAGREAPAWFARLLSPPPSVKVFALDGGLALRVEAEASRAILDSWDDLTRRTTYAVATVALISAFAFWSVRRALAPIPVIVDGLQRVQQGDLRFRLPALRGDEAVLIGAAFNRMAQAVEEKVEAERAAREAEARLDERREMVRLVEQRLDEERRLIARELHDEFGQSVTAIRSLALAIVSRAKTGEGRDGSDAGEGSRSEVSTGAAAQMVADEAAKMYDAMHGLIPRLAPLALDSVGLAQSLEQLVGDWQRRTPTPVLRLGMSLDVDLGPSAALAVYRVVQEGLSNALRHAQAQSVAIDVRAQTDAIDVIVADDGIGLPADWARPGHFGLRGLADRVANLGGTFDVMAAVPHGVRLVAKIPLVPAPLLPPGTKT